MFPGESGIRLTAAIARGTYLPPIMADGKKWWFGPSWQAENRACGPENSHQRSKRRGGKKIEAAATAQYKGSLETPPTAQTKWGRDSAIPMGRGSPPSALFWILTVNLLTMPNICAASYLGFKFWICFELPVLPRISWLPSLSLNSRKGLNELLGKMLSWC